MHQRSSALVTLHKLTQPNNQLFAQCLQTCQPGLRLGSVPCDMHLNQFSTQCVHPVVQRDHRWKTRSVAITILTFGLLPMVKMASVCVYWRR